MRLEMYRVVRTQLDYVLTHSYAILFVGFPDMKTTCRSIKGFFILYLKSLIIQSGIVTWHSIR